MIAPSDLERHLANARSGWAGPLPGRHERRRFVSRLLRRDSSAPIDHEGAESSIVLRPAHDGDEASLAQLAELDGHRLPPGDARILIESRGRVLAAADIASGDTVSDPFVPTAAAVALLRLRAAQLR